jgi:hypothetical protein
LPFAYFRNIDFTLLEKLKKTGLKGMNFDHDFVYSFPLFSSLLEKEGRRKGE